MRNRVFLWDCVVVFFGVGAVAIGLRFPSYFDHWVYFPSWPNLGDSLIMVVAGLLLLLYVGLVDRARTGRLKTYLRRLNPSQPHHS